jgi:tetratricopeptide (TPR) repeat protein
MAIVCFTPLRAFNQVSEWIKEDWKKTVEYAKYRDIESAIKVFNDSIKDSKDPSKFFFLRSLCHYYNEHYDKAKMDFDRSGSLDDMNPIVGTYHEGLTCYIMKYINEIRGREKDVKIQTLDERVYKPVNVSLVIDVSGSMYQDRRLHRLKASLKKIVEILRPSDKLSLIVFNHQLLLELRNVQASERSDLLQIIDNLQPDGGTVFALPISKAYEQVKSNYLASGKNQIIMATDGEYLEGINALVDLKSMIKNNSDSVTFSVVGISQTDKGARLMNEMTDLGKGIYWGVTQLEPNTDALITVLKLMSVDETVKEFTIVDGIEYPTLRSKEDSSMYERAEDLIARRGLDRALKILKSLEQKYSNSPVIYKRSGEIYQFYQTEYIRAVEAWDRVLRVAPRNADGFANKGFCYYRIGDYNKAINAYKLAVKTGNDIRGHNNLGCAYWKNQNIEPPHPRDIADATDCFENAARDKNSDAYPEITMNKGLAYLKANSFQLAHDEFTRLITLDPTHADAFLFRGFSLLGLEQFASARTDIQTAMDFQYLPFDDK